MEGGRRRSQVDEGEGRVVGGGKEKGGKKRGMRGSLFLLSVGGLRLVEVAGTAVGVVVRQVDGGTIQVEVAAARAAGGEAADRTTTPGRNKEDNLNL